MVKRSVLIHCNADLARGMGHLVRSICLAEEALSQGWSVAIAGEFGGRAIEHAQALAPAVELIALEPSEDFESLRALLIQRGASLLHLDSYESALDSIDFGSIALSNMQDGRFGRRAADLHIDANLDSEIRYQKVEPEERMILGTSGMQIRRAFRSLAYQPRAELTSPYRVLVMLGGTDPFDLTPRLVNALARHPSLSLSVICRPEIQAELREQLGARADSVAMLSFTEDLPNLAASMDLVVTAAGTSVWDFAAAGIPMGIVAVAENQLPGYRSCEASGVGIALGEPPHDDLEASIAALLAALSDRVQIERFSTLGTDLVDGLGAWRVVSAWRELIHTEPEQRVVVNEQQDSELLARPATMEDGQLLFDWRNDDATRAASRVSDSLRWDDHILWLASVLKDQNRKLLIVEERGCPIATVRWDRHSENSWEASITLAPSQRGRGLAARVLAVGEKVFGGEMPTRLLAGIHVSNAASQRLFARAGYLPFMPADEAGFEMRAKWLV